MHAHGHGGSRVRGRARVGIGSEGLARGRKARPHTERGRARTSIVAINVDLEQRDVPSEEHGANWMQARFPALAEASATRIRGAIVIGVAVANATRRICPARVHRWMGLLGSGGGGVGGSWRIAHQLEGAPPQLCRGHHRKLRDIVRRHASKGLVVTAGRAVAAAAAAEVPGRKSVQPEGAPGCIHEKGCGLVAVDGRPQARGLRRKVAEIAPDVHVEACCTIGSAAGRRERAAPLTAKQQRIENLVSIRLGLEASALQGAAPPPEHVALLLRCARRAREQVGPSGPSGIDPRVRCHPTPWCCLR
jgi:hypothetical protein